jgi:beta-galactosidase
LEVSIGGASGCIERLCYALEDGASSGGSTSYSLLDEPLQPCFYRACTDNDRGGSGGSSYAGRWVAAGLDRLAVDGESVVTAVLSAQSPVASLSAFPSYHSSF